MPLLSIPIEPGATPCSGTRPWQRTRPAA